MYLIYFELSFPLCYTVSKQEIQTKSMLRILLILALAVTTASASLLSVNEPNVLRKRMKKCKQDLREQKKNCQRNHKLLGQVINLKKKLSVCNSAFEQLQGVFGPDLDALAVTTASASLLSVNEPNVLRKRMKKCKQDLREQKKNCQRNHKLLGQVINLKKKLSVCNSAFEQLQGVFGPDLE